MLKPKYVTLCYIFRNDYLFFVGHLIKNTVIRRVLKVLMWTLIVLLSVPALLYVPFVQDFAKDIALKEVAKSSEIGRAHV